MRSLTLFRHAKTERESASGRDFDRVLTERGRDDARRMGEEPIDFDLLLSSPAARAAETAELAGLRPRFDERIYNATTGDLLALVQAVDHPVRRLGLVGHNPGFEQLASMLSGEQVEMPTGSLVEIELPIDRWSEAGSKGGRLVRFVKPKELG